MQCFLEGSLYPPGISTIWFRVWLASELPQIMCTMRDTAVSHLSMVVVVFRGLSTCAVSIASLISALSPVSISRASPENKTLLFRIARDLVCWECNINLGISGGPAICSHWNLAVGQRLELWCDCVSKAKVFPGVGQHCHKTFVNGSRFCLLPCLFYTLTGKPKRFQIFKLNVNGADFDSLCLPFH